MKQFELLPIKLIARKRDLYDYIININMIAGSEDILQTPYSDTFSCEGQGYGYYADVQSGCQVIKQKHLPHNFPQQVTL